MAPTDFSKKIQNWAAKAERRLNFATKKATLDLVSSIVVGTPYGVGTPVDTGRARGAWTVSLNTEAGLTAVFDRSGNQAIANAAGKLQNYKPGDVIYITNKVSYIHDLEYGSSRQAPNGMVRVAIRSWGSMVRNAARAARGVK